MEVVFCLFVLEFVMIPAHFGSCVFGLLTIFHTSAASLDICPISHLYYEFFHVALLALLLSRISVAYNLYPDFATLYIALFIVTFMFPQCTYHVFTGRAGIWQDVLACSFPHIIKHNF